MIATPNSTQYLLRSESVFNMSPTCIAFGRCDVTYCAPNTDMLHLVTCIAKIRLSPWLNVVIGTFSALGSQTLQLWRPAYAHKMATMERFHEFSVLSWQPIKHAALSRLNQPRATPWITLPSLRIALYWRSVFAGGAILFCAHVICAFVICAHRICAHSSCAHCNLRTPISNCAKVNKYYVITSNLNEWYYS